MKEVWWGGRGEPWGNTSSAPGHVRKRENAGRLALEQHTAAPRLDVGRIADELDRIAESLFDVKQDGSAQLGLALPALLFVPPAPHLKFSRSA